MFTSFSNRSAKFPVYANTVRNWASFLPIIQPLLFTTFTDGPIITLAKQYGWIVLPNPRVNQYGSPYLKDMYRSAFNVNATLYGFANGDILFDWALIDALNITAQHLPDLKSTLVYGTRWNYKLNNSVNSTAKQIWPPKIVRSLANNKRSSFFRYDAYDYFIVDRSFPFDKIKDLVIARSGFDTYLVAMTNNLKGSTVDASHAVSAVHQTDSDGNFAHNLPLVVKDKDFNRKIIGKFNYASGYPNSVQYSVKRDSRNRLYLACRRCPNKKDLY